MNASGTIFLTISALIYTTIITILFLTKKKVDKIENKIFKKMLLLTIISMISELSIVFTVSIPIIGTIVQKIFLVFVLLWLSEFMIYSFVIIIFDKKKSDEENIEKYKKFFYGFLILVLVLIICILITPIYFHDIGNAKYTYGPSVNIIYGTTAMYMFIIFISLITHIRSVKNKGCLPIIALLFLLMLTAFIQSIRPEMLLSNAVFGLIICLMYNTIENPDLRLIAQLELARDHADKANNAKTEFLSSMSHEIRTPLNGIVGSVQLLELEENLSDDGKDAIKDLKTASDNLLEIGSGILDISQIETGKIELIEKEYSPKETFTDLANLLSKRIGEKNIKFSLIFAEDLPNLLYGDKGKIKEIITNLLTNAIKYTDEGKIELNIRCINNKDVCKLIISVSDTGRGIKKEMMDKLFQKFSRDEDVTNTTIEGVGLGLAITKNLVEFMGGKVDVNSTIGIGSVFTVTIIQKIIETIPKITLDLNQDKIDNVVNNNCEILIVDDNPMNLKIEQKHLEYYGLKVTLCNSGNECIELIQTGKKYNLILMDDMMPDISGTDTMKKLKNDLGYNMPIIVLTANAKIEDKDKYLNEGFDNYISKPVSRESLYNSIKNYL